MIDWATVEIPLNHTPIYGGEVISILPDGTQEWSTPKRMQAVGSYEKKLSFRSVGGDGAGKATHLWISGNPSKFLQGHNVFGSDDLVSLVADTFAIIAKQFCLKPTLQEQHAIAIGDYQVNKVDINYSFDLPCRSDVLAFIRAMEFKAKTRHGRPSMKGGTLYFGDNRSPYWFIKLYCKAEEIETNRGALPIALQNLGIEQWVENKLRIELTLKRKQLRKLDVINAKDLSAVRVRELFNDYLRKLEMKEQIALTSEQQMNLPHRLQSTYILWREGRDLRNVLPRPTYYRHRKELLEHGIDINLCQESLDRSNVVPLVKIIEAQPAVIPRFAYEKRLVHSSANSSAA
ncbi:phage/plasmid replication protein, II/X family [Aliagarivorans taiwanensis]|uniref:phage/plasmid replication protein, II/X family n=1 Tax=Aliagarivorans taiwanensis TaxID=561966 RepID=UPI0003FD5550|nr:phage/plasmid replication protein, II/X family [Aliagarivorans taiwanensis]